MSQDYPHAVPRAQKLSTDQKIKEKKKLEVLGFSSFGINSSCKEFWSLGKALNRTQLQNYIWPGENIDPTRGEIWISKKKDWTFEIFCVIRWDDVGVICSPFNPKDQILLIVETLDEAIKIVNAALQFTKDDS